MPFAIDRGDEASRLLRQLSHVQERQQQLAKAHDELKAAQDDQQDEMSHWATETLCFGVRPWMPRRPMP